jgi:formylglycine-generating enzyme required for sulfatase activity
MDMEWANPAVVNLHEAHAYCKWRTARTGKNTRITTELEHHLLRRNAAGGSPETRCGDSIQAIPNGIVDPVLATGTDRLVAEDFLFNLNLSYGGETPVGAVEAATGKASPQSFYDVFGNVWQWCEDYFNALPGFNIHPYYEDFSTPCFDGLHHVIMGGSFASTGNEASR